MSMALVVDAKPPEALIGRVPRVPILHPIVGCRGNDEEHQGGHTAQCAPAGQRVQHQGQAWDRVLLQATKNTQNPPAGQNTHLQNTSGSVSDTQLMVNSDHTVKLLIWNFPQFVLMVEMSGVTLNFIIAILKTLLL